MKTRCFICGQETGEVEIANLSANDITVPYPCLNCATIMADKFIFLVGEDKGYNHNGAVIVDLEIAKHHLPQSIVDLRVAYIDKETAKLLGMEYEEQS